mgnify:CR=1 FL=1
MSLEANATVQMRRLIAPGLALIGVAAVLLLLVRWEKRDLTLPFVFLVLSLTVVVLNDASFIWGVRPFDGGDDGLFYEGVGRQIAQYLRAGEWAKALEGGESVYFYGGPGLRYFRAIEQFMFGDTFYAYLSLMLALPFVVFLAFRRFFSPRVALGFTLMFIAIPVGALFGTSFFNYAKWAARGFADPAAAALFIGGFVLLLGPTTNGPSPRFAPAACHSQRGHGRHRRAGHDHPQRRHAAHHKADSVAAGHVQQPGIQHWQRQRTHLTERQHTASDAATHVTGRGTRGFREQNAVP